MTGEEPANQEPAEWESPWPTDKIRTRGSSWSLAGDAGLLNRLQSMSETMLSKTDGLQKNLKSLIAESKATNSRISNSVNEFLMLSNSQFVENRVYDEETTEETPSEEKKVEVQEKTKEQKEAELVPRISAALMHGLKVIDDAFERHEVVDSDSEDEDGSSQNVLPVLEPKDPYLHRPLPYIIGSDKFMSDDKVGLTDLLSDDEGEESEKESLTESERSAVGEKKHLSSSDMESDVESENSLVQKHVNSATEWETKQEQDVEGDIFGSDSSSPLDKPVVGDDDIKSKCIKETNKFASELNAKLNAGIKPINTLNNDERKQNGQIQEKKSKDSPKFHQNEKKTNLEFLDDNEEVDSPFTRRDGLFSTTGEGNLFDDINEQEDLFSELVKKNGPLKDSKDSLAIPDIGKKMSFTEGDIFPSENSRNSLSSSSHSSRKDGIKSLFEDDDDEPDLFITKSNVSITSGHKKSLTMFDDEDDYLFLFTDNDAKEKEQSNSSKETNSPKKSLPAGAVSLFGNAVNPMTAAIKSRRMLEVENEQEDKTSSNSDKGQSENTASKLARSTLSIDGNKAAVKKESCSSSVSSTSLFAEELETDDAAVVDHDLFQQKAKFLIGTSLFNDDLDGLDGGDLFAPSNDKRKHIEIEQEKLFSLQRQTLIPTLENSDASLKGSKANHTENAICKEEREVLFSDEDPLFGGSHKQAPALDIFKIDNLTSNSKTPIEQLPSFKSNAVSLFDSDEEDIFGSKKKDQKILGKPPVPTPRKASLPKDEMKTEILSESIHSENSQTKDQGKDASQQPFGQTKIVNSLSSPFKMLAGAVPLFGGIDPFTETLKSQENNSPNFRETSSKSNPTTESASNQNLETVRLPSPKKIDLSLKATTEDPTSFENPIKIYPLPNAAKERAKVQVKRRLPSRKARREALKKPLEEKSYETNRSAVMARRDYHHLSSSDRLKDSGTALDSADQSSPLDEEALTNAINTLVTSPSTEGEDLFSPTDSKLVPLLPDDTDINLFPNNGARKNFTEDANCDVLEEPSFLLPNQKKNLNLENDVFTDGSLTPQLKPESNNRAVEKMNDDLFSSASQIPSDFLPKSYLSEKRKATPQIFDDDSDCDDLFANLSSKKITTISSANSSSNHTDRKQQQSLFGDSDDDDLDIFNSYLSKKK